MDMSLVYRVQMVAGRMKQEHHFAMLVIMATKLGKKQL
jgi:hypothetical protein